MKNFCECKRVVLLAKGKLRLSLTTKERELGLHDGVTIVT